MGYLPNNCHPTVGREASGRQMQACEVGGSHCCRCIQEWARGDGGDQERQQKAPSLCWHTVGAQGIHVSGPFHKTMACSHSDFCCSHTLSLSRSHSCFQETSMVQRARASALLAQVSLGRRTCSASSITHEALGRWLDASNRPLLICKRG